MFRVLIVDDEPWSREVVKKLGDWMRFQLNVVGEAEDGTQALAMIAKLNPHVVITDMRMPGINGADLLRTMSEQFPSLKVIVMSGYEDLDYMKQAIRSRAVDYLLKPVDPEELNHSLVQCISELKNRSNAPYVSLSTPVAFSDSRVLERYVNCRSIIFGYLLELDKDALVRTFAKLNEFLESALSGEEDQTLLTRIGHDFVVTLEEFLSDSNTFHRLKPNASLISNDSVTEAINSICRLYVEAIDVIEEVRRSSNRLDVNQVRAHIDRHFCAPISLETVAHQFCVSKEHLSRTFKTNTGETVTDYITRRRMENAKTLITQQGLAIKHVAEIIGYTDLAYFYRVFKKFFGQTPGELRDNNTQCQ